MFQEIHKPLSIWMKGNTVDWTEMISDSGELLLEDQMEESGLEFT